jgi:hypothetical protein
MWCNTQPPSRCCLAIGGSGISIHLQEDSNVTIRLAAIQAVSGALQNAECKLHLAKHDGRAEALLIAHWALNRKAQ